MRSDVAIDIRGLGKTYLIGHKGDRPDTFRDMLAGVGNRFARSALDLARGRPIYSGDTIEKFRALDDVSFEVKKGEAVGIIGRNGAGKSTMLKVISRITEPTDGRVTVRGRLASLLEVGTGFHPELTGRENIFLNGAILGMSRSEIARKFDEIIDFAGVERFLDTPVKRYSSGMYVRLAFAVSAHLETDILVVDEVLAVGDAEFQRKCLGKMQDSTGEGRTVLFVSHNLDIVRQLCTKAAHLTDGRLTHFGDIDSAIQSYLKKGDTSNSINFAVPKGKPAIASISYDEKKLSSGILDAEIGVSVPSGVGNLYGGLILKSATGVPVWGSNSQIHPGSRSAPFKSGVFNCVTPSLPLSAGQYFLSVWLSTDAESLDSKIDVLELIMTHNPQQPGRPPGEVMGFMELEPAWEFAERAHRNED